MVRDAQPLAKSAFGWYDIMVGMASVGRRGCYMVDEQSMDDHCWGSKKTTAAVAVSIRPIAY